MVETLKKVVPFIYLYEKEDDEIILTA